MTLTKKRLLECLISVGILISFRGGGFVLAASSAVQDSEIYVGNSCTSSEHWHWSSQENSLNPNWIREFESSILEDGSKIRGFSEALALRKLAKNSQERVFSEYWMSRSLYASGLIHLSQKGFEALLKNDVDLSTAPFQLAALACLSSIHRQYSGIGIDGTLVPKIIQLNEMTHHFVQNPQALKSIIWEAALYLSLDGIHNTPDVLALMKNSGPFEALSLGALHSSQSRFEEALKDLSRFFVESQSLVLFNPFTDRAHLLFSRAAYALGRYPEAIQHYQLIRSHSNEWVHGLSELSWSFLRETRYREAVGTAIGLQSGSFKKTFAPEALMVMAMALNEMCRFPDSMSVIQTFRRIYRDSYFWLKDQPTGLSQDFYKSAVDFAKRSPTSKVPPPIASEWIRSAIFLSNQERINLIYKEKGLTNELSQQGKDEQKTMTLRLLQDAKTLHKQFRLAKIKAANNEGLPTELISKIQLLKEDLVHLRHLKSAAPIWRKVLSSYQARVPEINRAMVSGINHEIVRLNQRMHAQLEEIAENNELIEIEILNGASEDIIWKNAHPGFGEAVKNMKRSGTQAAAEKVWDWGKTQGGLDGRSEIWEDEIGSLTADLNDNCESKDKYAAVERGSAL